MTGTNHALTGALIASLISAPVVFIPLAVASHFFLDSLPHFGEPFGQRKLLSKSVWAIDFMLLVVGLTVLLLTKNWALLVGAFAAISPDLAWIYRFVVKERWGSLPPTKTNKLNTWHAKIQKYEYRNGLVFEIVLLVILVYISWELVV